MAKDPYSRILSTRIRYSSSIDQMKELKDPRGQKLWLKGFQFEISFFVSAETPSFSRNTGITGHKYVFTIVTETIWP